MSDNTIPEDDDAFLDITALQILTALRNLAGTVFFWLLATHACGLDYDEWHSSLSIVTIAAVILTVGCLFNPTKYLSPGKVSLVLSYALGMVSFAAFVWEVTRHGSVPATPLFHMIVTLMCLAHLTATKIYRSRAD